MIKKINTKTISNNRFLESEEWISNGHWLVKKDLVEEKTIYKVKSYKNIKCRELTTKQIESIMDGMNEDLKEIKFLSLKTKIDILESRLFIDDDKIKAVNERYLQDIYIPLKTFFGAKIYLSKKINGGRDNGLVIKVNNEIVGIIMLLDVEYKKLKAEDFLIEDSIL